MRGSGLVCWARAASGHATATPPSVMNSRRLIHSPDDRRVEGIVAGETRGRKPPAACTNARGRRNASALKRSFLRRRDVGEPPVEPGRAEAGAAGTSVFSLTLTP